MSQDSESGESGSQIGRAGISPKLVVVFLVLAVFAGVFVAKAMSGSTGGTKTAQSSSATAAAGDSAGASAQDDAVAAYEAALKRANRST